YGNSCHTQQVQKLKRCERHGCLLFGFKVFVVFKPEVQCLTKGAHSNRNSVT
ncbi:hypothetical protein RUM43_009260, partial [Polyplax serrata]